MQKYYRAFCKCVVQLFVQCAKVLCKMYPARAFCNVVHQSGQHKCAKFTEMVLQDSVHKLYKGGFKECCSKTLHSIVAKELCTSSANSHSKSF